MTEFTSKVQYYQLWSAGKLGNKPASWDNLDSFLSSSYLGLVNVRCVIPGSPHMVYGVPKSGVVDWIKGTGLADNQFKFNEPMPDNKLTIQGEVMHDHRGYSLFFSQEKTTMRQALKNG